MVASALPRNSVSIEEWSAATTFLKYCTLKKLFLAINTRKKMFYESLLIISLRFLHIVINYSRMLFQCL